MLKGLLIFCYSIEIGKCTIFIQRTESCHFLPCLLRQNGKPLSDIFHAGLPSFILLHKYLLKSVFRSSHVHRYVLDVGILFFTVFMMKHNGVEQIAPLPMAILPFFHDVGNVTILKTTLSTMCHTQGWVTTQLGSRQGVEQVKATEWSFLESTL